VSVNEKAAAEKAAAEKAGCLLDEKAAGCLAAGRAHAAHAPRS
jgi:hypothetical protein